MSFGLALLAASAALTPALAAVDTPVLARAVEKGETLAASDFTTAALSPANARAAVPPGQAQGQEATRRLAAGSPVRATDLAAPRLIRRGQGVTITVVSGSLRIAATGRALSDGSRGDAVRVLNLSTNRTLDAVAEAPGEARVVAQ